MNDYLKSQSKTNEAIIKNVFTQDEIERFSHSDLRWAEKRIRDSQNNNNLITRKIRKGEIYQFEFGKNYIPEMSYEHRGLVIGIKQKLLYVLPIFSYDPKKQKDVYHPVDNPNSKSDLFLLKNNEFSFISHDSVLKLNDLRTLSISRILYRQQNGYIDPTSDTYKQIETLVFLKCFPSFYRELELARQEKNNSQVQIKQITEENAKLKAELYELKNKLKN